MQVRGTCTVDGCTAPLEYAGTGRPRAYCVVHRKLTRTAMSNERSRRCRARQRAAAQK